LTVEPHGRNPALADALKRIGLAERGIDRIFEGSIKFGRPLPDYTESTERYVKLFIQRAEPDLAFTRMISNEENRMGRNLPINSLLILSTLQTQRRASLHELADTIHISEPRTKANVERLLESGLVEARGTGRGRIYILSAKVYKEQANAVGYVRQTGIDKLKYDELALKLVKEQGYATREDVSELLGISGDQAYRILRGLVDRKCLLLSGKGRGAKYLESQK